MSKIVMTAFKNSALFNGRWDHAVNAKRRRDGQFSKEKGFILRNIESEKRFC